MEGWNQSGWAQRPASRPPPFRAGGPGAEEEGRGKSWVALAQAATRGRRSTGTPTCSAQESPLGLGDGDDPSRIPRRCPQRRAWCLGACDSPAQITSLQRRDKVCFQQLGHFQPGRLSGVWLPFVFPRGRPLDPEIPALTVFKLRAYTRVGIGITGLVGVSVECVKVVAFWWVGCAHSRDLPPHSSFFLSAWVSHPLPTTLPSAEGCHCSRSMSKAVLGAGINVKFPAFEDAGLRGRRWCKLGSCDAKSHHVMESHIMRWKAITWHKAEAPEVKSSTWCKARHDVDSHLLKTEIFILDQPIQGDFRNHHLPGKKKSFSFQVPCTCPLAV